MNWKVLITSINSKVRLLFLQTKSFCPTLYRICSVFSLYLDAIWSNLTKIETNIYEIMYCKPNALSVCQSVRIRNVGNGVFVFWETCHRSQANKITFQSIHCDSLPDFYIFFFFFKFFVSLIFILSIDSFLSNVTKCKRHQTMCRRINFVFIFRLVNVGAGE